MRNFFWRHRSRYFREAALGSASYLVSVWVVADRATAVAASALWLVGQVVLALLDPRIYPAECAEASTADRT